MKRASCGKSTKSMEPKEVFELSEQFLAVMEPLAPPQDFCFRTFATRDFPGLAELCEKASRVCAGGADALASLTIAPGAENSFTQQGSHARATVCAPGASSARLVVAILLAIVALVAFFLLRR